MRSASTSPLRWDDWWLLETISQAAHAGRALSRRRIFTRDGRLVASSVEAARVATDLSPAAPLQRPLPRLFTESSRFSVLSSGGVETVVHDSRRQPPSSAMFANDSPTESITRTGSFGSPGQRR